MSVYSKLVAVLTALVAVLAIAVPCAAADVNVRYLFALSDFSGTLPYSGGRLVSDGQTDEIYVAASNRVRVFNASGMEIYSFGHEPDLGLVRDLAVDGAGDILVLSHDMATGSDEPYLVTRCDYRGAAKSRLELSGFSDQFASMVPDRLFLREGRVYLASRVQKLVAVVDAVTGEFVRGHDLTDSIDLSQDGRTTSNVVGFDVGPDGSLLFTIPTLFRAFVVSPDGAVSTFGKPGSTPGSFSVVSDIATDGRGHFFVADKGRSVVMVFDERFEFLTEFGEYGDGQENLVRPNDLAIAPSGRLYVTQMKNRGISAFSVSFQ